MKPGIHHSLIVAAAILLLSLPAAGDDLDATLGLDKRVGFRELGPSRTLFSLGQPIQTIAIPDGFEIPLQATSEALAFYAAYQARNYRAMAAVGAMSAWGGTLRRGVDAVVGSSDDVSFEDLGKLSTRGIAILGYLWDADGRSGTDLYREMGADQTWSELAAELEDMEKAHLIRKVRVESRHVFSAEVTPIDVRRAILASGNPERITAVFLAINGREPDTQSKATRESIPTGHRVETQ